MQTFKITVQRSFDIEVEAESREKAIQVASLYLGYHDEATDNERTNNRFSIQKIEMLENEIVDVVEIRI